LRPKFQHIRQSYDRVLVVFGDCGSRGALDAFLAREGLERIDSPHCYEMYAGAQFAEMMDEEAGTFFLTDFLVRGFRGTIWHGLGLDRYPQLLEDYFRHYRRLVFLTQSGQPELMTRAQEIATTLGLPLEVRHTGYERLEVQLKEWMERHAL
jgi:hypothetical protein